MFLNIDIDVIINVIKYRKIQKSTINNPEKLAIYGTQDVENIAKAQHDICWTPLYANKDKEAK